MFRKQVNTWIGPERTDLRGSGQPLDAPSYRCAEVALMHPRFEFVFQPIQAAYLSLEPRWKTLRSLPLKGKHEDHLARNHTNSGTSCLSTRTRIFILSSGALLSPSAEPISEQCCRCTRYPYCLANAPFRGRISCLLHI